LHALSVNRAERSGMDDWREVLTGLERCAASAPGFISFRYARVTTLIDAINHRYPSERPELGIGSVHLENCRLCRRSDISGGTPGTPMYSQGAFLMPRYAVSVRRSISGTPMATDIRRDASWAPRRRNRDARADANGRGRSFLVRRLAPPTRSGRRAGRR